MPNEKGGSIQDLMKKLWLMKHAINSNTKGLDHGSHMEAQGMKQLIGHCEDYMLDHGFYASQSELEQAEFDATRIGQYNETNGEV